MTTTAPSPATTGPSTRAAAAPPVAPVLGAPSPGPDALVHLSPAAWAGATRALVRKALAEFSHERLLTPAPLDDRPDDGSSDGSGDGSGGGPGSDARRRPRRYEVRSDDGSAAYRFTARVLPLDHWSIEADSIELTRDGVPAELDALRMVLDLRGALGLSAEVLPVYLEEVTSTVAARAHTLTTGGPSAAELVDAAFPDVESAMTAGHPCFVATNGRLGFDADEYLAHAPEAGRPVHLVWVAVRRDLSTFTAGAGLTEEEVYAHELDPEVRAGFDARLTGLGLDPADYRPVPVHPWQWRHRISVTFAADLARRDLVLLGEGPDEHRAQQSIRTFLNTTTPRRHYVKTALSVLNMGFMRGLSTEYMAVTPQINDWVHDLVAGDPVLAASGFRVLRERASVGYRPPVFEAATTKGSPYRKMLAALWRESPVTGLAPGQRLVTMASLLHVDDAGRSFAAALVERSGRTPRQWLRRYLDAYLVPVAHCLSAHDLVFMPHGENLVLVLEDAEVVSVFMKDIGEEVALMSTTTALPPDVERIRVQVPEEVRLLSIQTDVLDCYLRHLAAVLDEAGVLDADGFWAEVAACLREHRAAHPELAEAHARDDLFAPSFALSCLNRLQLKDNRQMVDLTDPASALALVGELENPLAAHPGAAGS